jgi:N-formylmaleamate deformylase
VSDDLSVIPTEPSVARVLTQPALADLADIKASSIWVRSGPVRLHLLDYGPAEATPVLVVPGITSPAISMDFLARELTDLARLIVLDVRGRGLSDNAPPSPAHPGSLRGYDLAAYASDVNAIIEQLRLTRPILFGHSMGARIAAAAATTGRHPLGGTVLVDPPMSGPGRAPYPTTLEAFMGQLDQARRGTDADEVAKSWPRWPRREQELRARWLASCSRTAIAATHAGFESEDFFTFWPKVPAPSVFIYGGDSPVVTATGAEEARATNPDATFIAVAATGHMVFWDDPASGLCAARDALRTLLSPSR